MTSPSEHDRLRETDLIDAPALLPEILMVNNLPINIAFAEVGLSDLCRVIGVSTGEQALRMALERLPDMIILSVRLPGMNGFETCRRLKENPLTEPIPVVFITTDSSEVSEERGLMLGAIDYITKPFNPTVLRARIRNHLMLARQRQKLERLSQLDGLTGIPNRRVFDQTFASEWLRQGQLQYPLSMLMADIDNFKLYNDHFGHLAGDKTLRDVAWAVMSAMNRQTDLAARYGGEEFACILPQTDHAGLPKLAQDICQKVWDLNIPHPLSAYGRVTVSVGGATMIPNTKIVAQELIDLADQRLYQAKRDGRNRINCG